MGGDFLDDDFKEKKIKTEYGTALIFMDKDNNLVFIPRHGKNKEIPPHKINHHANIMALKKLKVKAIISTSSVGSLKEEILPKSILIPHDYINFWNIPTFFNEGQIHITPSLDETLRELIARVARKLNIKIISKGIYFQTSGPRLETKAEISLIKKFADVVGMTMGSEATLAKELKLRYASICQVDNYCHGITSEKLDFKKVIEEAEKSREELIKLLGGVTKELI
jgi:5'-methylthioadenosine phosphorylase